MRLENACDSMNLTGCDALHTLEKTGHGFKHFIYVYQIEVGVGIVLGVVSFALIVLLVLWLNKRRCNG